MARVMNGEAVTPASMKKDARIAILGAGACGMLMGHRLKAAGFENFTIFEKGDGVGGTWRRHTYPGLCCDVHSHIYCYSFDPNPYWSKMFPERDELLAYFTNFAEKHGLMEHVRLSSEVTNADYDEAQGAWTLTLAKSDNAETFDYLIAATGFYNDTFFPDIPGRERFRGPSFHSSQWRHDVDLKGRRVAVVGTAAAAVQIVPAIHPDVAQLTIFQRSPPWVLPRVNTLYSEDQQRVFAEDVGAWRRHREELHAPLNELLDGMTGDKHKLDELRKACLAFLEQEIADPALRAKLTPDYDPGCKRLVITSDYCATLAKPNVSVISEAITQIDETGVITRNGARHEVDVLIWCTGYKMPNYHGPVRTAGIGGKTLKDAWPDLPEAFRGVSVPDFPNYFMINGPNGIFGYTSTILSAEITTNYVTRLIEAAEQQMIKAIDVRPDVYRAYNRRVQDFFVGTTFAGNCNSFYHDEKHRVWFFYPGDYDAMEKELGSTTLEDFNLLQ